MGSYLHWLDSYLQDCKQYVRQLPHLGPILFLPFFNDCGQYIQEEGMSFIFIIVCINNNNNRFPYKDH